MPDDDPVLVDPWIDLRGAGIEEEAGRQRLTQELRAETARGHLLLGGR
jgi:hypothetical protein